MKIYKLTGEGIKQVRIPAQVREEILDHLYEFRTSTFDELSTIMGNKSECSTKLREYIKKGLVTEVT